MTWNDKNIIIENEIIRLRDTKTPKVVETTLGVVFYIVLLHSGELLELFLHLFPKRSITQHCKNNNCIHPSNQSRNQLRDRKLNLQNM